MASFYAPQRGNQIIDVCSSGSVLHTRTMTTAESFRANAAEQLRLALIAKLPNRRTMHERSAEMWNAMAQSAEQTADRTAVNAAAKATG